nr:hypothetical protein [Tanacetum cinerariifolium]
MQKREDLKGDDLKHYEAEIEAMNLILISILNDLYNSVDACKTAKAMWQRVKRLMRSTCVSFNCFAQLMNDLEINDIIFPNVTINTKFLNCLQPEWLKYVTQVPLAKILAEDSYDDLFDYLQQFKKLVNASRTKKVEKLHDPFALVAYTGSSSRTTTPYYITHPSSVVDYDDDYQGDAVQKNSNDSLTSAMILLARAITQRFSNPTTNRLYTSSNTINQAIIQGDRVNIQSKNSGNDDRNIYGSYVQEEIIEVNVQCYNCSEKGHYACNCPKPRVWDSKYFLEQVLLAKQDEAGVILTDEHNDFLFANASRMEDIKEQSANVCLMARIQPTNFDSDEGPSYDYAFLILSENYSEFDYSKSNLIKGLSKSVFLNSTNSVKRISRIEFFFVYKDPIIKSQEMSTSNTHQQSLVDAGSETRPLSLQEEAIYHGQVILEDTSIEKDSYDDLFDYLQQFKKLGEEELRDRTTIKH